MAIFRYRDAHGMARWIPAFAGMAVVMSLSLAAIAAPLFPTLTGRVVDDAGILHPETRAALVAKLKAHEQKTGEQVVVVTLKSIKGYPIEQYGYQLGRAWGIGQQGKNNGALLIVVPDDHEVRIEVGYGLEGILTDALSRYILNSAVIPAFKAGEMEKGVVQGTDALLAALADPQTAQKQLEDSKNPAGYGWLVLIVLFFIALRFLGVIGVLPFVLGGRRGSGGIFPLDGGGGGNDNNFSGGGGGFGGGGASGRW